MCYITANFAETILVMQETILCTEKLYTIYKTYFTALLTTFMYLDVLSFEIFFNVKCC